MKREAEGPHRRLHGGLAKGRVGVDGVGEARQCHAVRHGERRLRYQVARAGTDDVRTEDRTARPVGDQ